jgi:L-seryl-tRNA(Ser) seleniumtransferase
LGDPHPLRLLRPVISIGVELRDLPSVDALARELGEALHADLGGSSTLPAALLTEIARAAVEDARESIRRGDDGDPLALALPEASRLLMLRPRRIINATGVLLHTNLGRAPLARTAATRGAEISAGYTNLEFDLGKGARGGRGAYVESLLRRLTGAEAALAVNNAAGGLLLALAALAGGRAVVISRGELIEIGGSFRLPLLMEASGAHLMEVGTTNRTRLEDYEAAVDGAAAILKVHPSNYRIEGFTDEVGYGPLADLAHRSGIPFVADVGSGLLDARTPWLTGSPPRWLASEPAVRQTLEAGADVVLFSGDKLLGGPQAGIAVGGGDVIEQMRRHPIARAVRLDGTSLATLGTTLELYASGRGGEIPIWHMASLDREELRARHDAVLHESGRPGAVVEGASTPGAGSVPGELIPSPVIQLDGAADALWSALVSRPLPVVGHRRHGALQLDLRTVDPEDDVHVVAALRSLG